MSLIKLAASVDSIKRLGNILKKNTSLMDKIKDEVSDVSAFTKLKYLAMDPISRNKAMAEGFAPKLKNILSEKERNRSTSILDHLNHPQSTANIAKMNGFEGHTSEHVSNLVNSIKQHL